MSNQILRSLDALQNTGALPDVPLDSSSASPVDPDPARALRAAALVSNGHISRAAKCLTQEGLLPVDIATCKALAALHPQASAPVPALPADAPSTLTVDKQARERQAMQRCRPWF